MDEDTVPKTVFGVLNKDFRQLPRDIMQSADSATRRRKEDRIKAAEDSLAKIAESGQPIEDQAQ